MPQYLNSLGKFVGSPTFRASPPKLKPIDRNSRHLRWGVAEVAHPHPHASLSLSSSPSPTLLPGPTNKSTIYLCRYSSFPANSTTGLAPDNSCIGACFPVGNSCAGSCGGSAAHGIPSLFSLSACCRRLLRKNRTSATITTAATAPTTMPPMAPPERGLDEEVVETEDGVEGAGVELALETSEALVFGAVVVSVELDDGVDEGVDECVDEGVLEETWEVVCVAAIRDLGSKAQAVAPGSAELREEYVSLRGIDPISMSTSSDLLQQMLVCPVDPVHDSLISFISKKRRRIAAGRGGNTRITGAAPLRPCSALECAAVAGARRNAGEAHASGVAAEGSSGRGVSGAG